MTKFKMIFVTALLVLVMVSGTAFAVTKDEKLADVGTSSYKKLYTGASSSCTMVADNEDVYTLNNNTSSSARFLTTSAWEFTFNVGWTKKDSDTDTVKYGYQVNSEISRNKSINGYYWHMASCYVPYTYQTLDSYTLRVNQIVD